jgi:hypothetical protein
MPKEKEVVVYWSPVFYDETGTDWNMLYYDLPSLYDDLRASMSKTDPANNLFYCPAFGGLTKNTFLIKNPIASHYVYEGRTARVKTKNYLGTNIVHEPSIKDHMSVEYGLTYVFFTEEDVKLTLTGPYFTNSSHAKHGAVIPGQMKINSWFRELKLEYTLWPGNNELSFEKDEVLAYVNFDCEEKVRLVRFEMNDKLKSYTKACGSASSWESFVPLADRYKRFKQTHMNKMVLNEIKKNLVDNV